MVPKPDQGPKRVVATGLDAINSLRLVRDLVRHAVSRLDEAGAGFGHGTDNAFDEAVWLVCWTLHLPVEHYAELADAAVAWPEARATLDLLERRCTSGKPLAYLIGEAWLMGHRFRCDERALVPRSLIAEALTGGALEAFMPELELQAEGSTDEASRLRVLDLCCGSASLAIIAAALFTDATVVASDNSAEALELAALNLADHRLDKRVKLVKADLFAGVGRQRFDLILCNPPYVNRQSLEDLPAEYLAEPRAALDGGDDGMDLVARILAQAADHLRPSGLLVLEIGNECRNFRRRFPQLEFAYVPVAEGGNRIAAIGASALKAVAAPGGSNPKR
jgi:ribosomal protein L3 glutamine methyltransferase